MSATLVLILAAWGVLLSMAGGSFLVWCALKVAADLRRDRKARDEELNRILNGDRS